MTCSRSHSSKIGTNVLDNGLYFPAAAMCGALPWVLCRCELLVSHQKEPKPLGPRPAFFPSTTLPPKDRESQELPELVLSLLCEEGCQPSASTTYSELWAWTNEGHSPCPGGMQAVREASPPALRGEMGNGSLTPYRSLTRCAGSAANWLGDPD